MKMNLFYFLALSGVFVLSGCVVRTYPLTRDRIDQDLSAGNRGYLLGSGPAVEKDRQEKRTTQVVEVELRSPFKFGKGRKKAVKPAPMEETLGEGAMQEEFSAQIPEGKYENYTVKKGDTLQKISSKYYGTTKKWHKLFEANKDVLKAPDKLYVGQVLRIPVEEIMAPSKNLK